MRCRGSKCAALSAACARAACDRSANGPMLVHDKASARAVSVASAGFFASSGSTAGGCTSWIGPTLRSSGFASTISRASTMRAGASTGFEPLRSRLLPCTSIICDHVKYSTLARISRRQRMRIRALLLAGAPVRRDVGDVLGRQLELALVLDLAGDDVADQALERRSVFAFPVVGVMTLRALALRRAAPRLCVRGLH